MPNAANDKRQFRFAYFTRNYQQTVHFYAEGLGFAVMDSWDRSTDDKGTVFSAASGRIEVLAQPLGGECDHLFDARRPQGAFMVIEVDDVDAFHAQLNGRYVRIERDLKDESWGHRSFLVREPDGLILYFYSEL